MKRKYILSLYSYKCSGLDSFTILEPGTPEYIIGRDLAIVNIRNGVIFMSDILYWQKRDSMKKHIYNKLYKLITEKDI